MRGDRRDPPAARRALLVTCSLGTLPGAERSVETMARMLGGRGFTCCVLRDHDSTRAGLLEALRALAEQTGPQDAVVVYYAGHGYARPLPNGAGRTVSAFVLATTDLRESTATDFRGLLDVELRKSLDEIARRTTNITVILDCCHAAGVVLETESEVPAAVLRSMRAVLGARVAAHQGPTRGSDDIVYVVAAAKPEIANEATDREGRPIYAFTQQLVHTLDRLAGTAVNWDEVVYAAAAGLPEIDAIQRPGVGGRRTRQVFERVDLPTRGWLGTVTNDRTIWLRAGSAMTLAAGDRLLVEPLVPGEDGVQVATVTEVGEMQAMLARPAGPLPDPPVVRAIRLIRAERPVVGVLGTRDAALEAAIVAGSFAPVAGAPPAAIATLEQGEGWTLRAGPEVLARWPAGATNMAPALLEWLGRLDACRTLANCGASEGSPAVTLEVTLDDQAASSLAADASVAAGSRIRVRVRNPHRVRALYFAVYRMTADRRIDLLVSRTAQGLCVLPEQVGEDLRLTLSWPEALDPGDGARAETLVVLASHEPLLAAHVPVYRGAQSSGGKTRGGAVDAAAVRAVTHRLRLLPPPSGRAR